MATGNTPMMAALAVVCRPLPLAFFRFARRTAFSIASRIVPSITDKSGALPSVVIGQNGVVMFTMIEYSRPLPTLTGQAVFLCSCDRPQPIKPYALLSFMQRLT